jgi:hypothetical protein
MIYANRFRVVPGKKVKLKSIDSGFKDEHGNHKQAAEEIEGYQKKLRKLQELQYTDGRFSSGVSCGAEGIDRNENSTQSVGTCVPTGTVETSKCGSARALSLASLPDSFCSSRQQCLCQLRYIHGPDFIWPTKRSWARSRRAS